MSQAREMAVRRWARQLSRPERYPVMYRLILGLPLCGGCLEELPVITGAICRQCGREQAGDSGSGELCRDCRDVTDESLQGNRSLLRYTAWGKGLLGLYKYRGDERLADFFSTLLAIAVHRYYEPARLDCVTAVPLHAERLQERGFNQVDLLACRLSQFIGVPALPLLARTKATAKLSQQEGGRAVRQKSMREAFSWAGGCAKPSAILLLDDIYTTGSTLRSCAATLREQLGPECRIFSLTIYR